MSEDTSRFDELKAKEDAGTITDAECEELVGLEIAEIESALGIDGGDPLDTYNEDDDGEEGDYLGDQDRQELDPIDDEFKTPDGRRLAH